LVPQSWEREFGDALVGDFGQNFCSGRGGQAALDKLGAKLSSQPGRVRLRVVNVPIVNAAALPGGTIMIFRELLAEAKGPDEVAGIVAHEIAHVENRHVTQMMIRQFGLSLILASVGGTTGGNVETLMTARYSRKSESQADGDAIRALQRSNISPLGTANFFARLARFERRYPALAGSLSYLSSHPLSDERRKRFEQGARKGQAYVPSLTAEEWKALVHICDHKDPGSKKAVGDRD
jgi:beta-barrel assembly-enhancing protease